MRNGRGGYRINVEVAEEASIGRTSIKNHSIQESHTAMHATTTTTRVSVSPPGRGKPAKPASSNEGNC